MYEQDPVTVGLSGVRGFFQLIGRRIKDRIIARRYARSANGQEAQVDEPLPAGEPERADALSEIDLDVLPAPERDIPADFSLLWPPGVPAGTSSFWLDKDSVQDLGLDHTIAAFTPEQTSRDEMRKLFVQLCQDPAVIGYRQDVIDDLLRYPDLAACFEKLLPMLSALSERGPVKTKGVPVLYRVIWQLSELEIYVECVKSLQAAFAEIGSDLRSEALGWLRDVVATIGRDEVFQNLVRELPGLLGQMRGISSVTIGVNLDSQMRPFQATLLSVNKEPFTEAKLLDMLVGSAGDLQGVTQLHRAPGAGSGTANPILVPLFRDLSDVMQQVCKPVEQALKQYVRFNTRQLAGLSHEFAFYLTAVQLIRRIEASGLPMCKPELAPQEERVCEIDDCFCLNLTLHLLLGSGRGDLRHEITPNKVRLGSLGHVFILTGPNQGGKTTYTQAVGLAQILAQVGMYVPGSRARISPVDGIYTHFPIEEKVGRDTGRFGEESKRLSSIFQRATRHSLVLLNESLSSTAAGESLYLARDVVRILMLMGARVIFATHLHELAAGVDALNAETAGDSRVASLVASLVSEGGNGTGDEIQRTYRVVPSPPMGYSYAQEIARRYGISFEQLEAQLKERGVLD